MNVATILRLAAKARATEQRIAAEQLAADTLGTREPQRDIVIEDSSERARVIVQFAGTGAVGVGSRSLL